jgi:hypothetical protein
MERTSKPRCASTRRRWPRSRELTSRGAGLDAGLDPGMEIGVDELEIAGMGMEGRIRWLDGRRRRACHGEVAARRRRRC